MSSYLDEKREELCRMVATQLRQFLEANQKWRNGDFAGAKTDIENSMLPQDVKDRLSKALETGEVWLIKRVFWEYDARLGNAFCESC